jgi:hypothetical protein
MKCGDRATKARRHSFALHEDFPIQSGVVVEESCAAALQKKAASVVGILT